MAPTVSGTQWSRWGADPTHVHWGRGWGVSGFLPVPACPTHGIVPEEPLLVRGPLGRGGQPPQWRSPVRCPRTWKGRGSVPQAEGGCNPQPPCVRTEGEELAGEAEGAGYPPQEPQCSGQVKTAPEGLPAEPHCWPVEATPRTDSEPTCSQGKAFGSTPAPAPWPAARVGFQQRCLPPLER